MDEGTRYSRLESPPAGIVRMVLDTDTYNEIDDQFALVYALLSPERLNVEAVYAAPFFAEWQPRSLSPADGMEKSFAEIQRVINILGMARPVYRGSCEFLANDTTAAPRSDAVDDLISRARDGEDLLYVVAIGAITNVASAILRAPDIVDKIIIVWLGSHASWWPHTKEFNHMQDVAAVRVVFGCGVPVIHIPCLGVASHLLTTPEELAQELKGRSAIGDYLFDLVDNYEYRRGPGWSKVIWDIATVAWLIDPDWIPSQLVHSPIAQDDFSWSADRNRHFIRQAYFVNRDRVFHDLFKKLNEYAA